MKIYEHIKKSKNYDLIKNQIIMQNSRSALSGAIRSCAANLIYALMEDSEKKGIYFAANSLNAGKIAEDLRFFSSFCWNHMNICFTTWRRKARNRAPPA